MTSCATSSRPTRANVGSKHFQRLAEVNGLPVIRLHDLRHSHATTALAAGVPVKVLSQRIGHADITVTLGTYAHVMPGDDEAAALIADGTWRTRSLDQARPMLRRRHFWSDGGPSPDVQPTDCRLSARKPSRGNSILRRADVVDLDGIEKRDGVLVSTVFA